MPIVSGFFILVIVVFKSLKVKKLN